jgi:two-component system, chemotaxis family, CheB/CheR fusion protein
MDLEIGDHASMNIAFYLHISQRTVEKHRAAIMRKMSTRSLPKIAHGAQSATRH